MTSVLRQSRNHRSDRIGWMRAAVIEANDGVVSATSLLPGVAAGSNRRSMLVGGVVELMSGSAALATGEYAEIWAGAIPVTFWSALACHRRRSGRPVRSNSLSGCLGGRIQRSKWIAVSVASRLKCRK